jgi:hypothetical protein
LAIDGRPFYQVFGSSRRRRKLFRQDNGTEIDGWVERRDEGLWVVCPVEIARTFFPQAEVFAKWRVPGSGTEKGGRIARQFAVTHGLLAEFPEGNGISACVR